MGYEYLTWVKRMHVNVVKSGSISTCLVRVNRAHDVLCICLGQENGDIRIHAPCIEVCDTEIFTPLPAQFILWLLKL